MTRHGRDRVLTIPNVLSVIRLVLVPVFLYLLLVTHAYALAVAILMFSGFSDWADGKIARLVANQSSRLGALLDPAVIWATAGRDVRFLAKSPLFEGPLKLLVAGSGAMGLAEAEVSTMRGLDGVHVCVGIHPNDLEGFEADPSGSMAAQDPARRSCAAGRFSSGAPAAGTGLPG